MKQDQRILVLGKQFNRKEIYQDLLNGQNTLEFKGKNAFSLNV